MEEEEVEMKGEEFRRDGKTEQTEQNRVGERRGVRRRSEEEGREGEGAVHVRARVYVCEGSNSPLLSLYGEAIYC